MKKLLLTTLVLASAQIASAQVISGFSENFNSGASSNDNFRFANGTSQTESPWNATVGTGGTGGLEVGTGATNVFYRTASDTTFTTYGINTASAGTVFTTSADFRFNTGSTALTVLTAGFTTLNLDNAFSDSTANTSLAGSIIRNGSSTVTLRLRNSNTNEQTLTFDQTTLTSDNWYRLEFNLTKTATANTFNYDVTLFSIGATGTGTPVIFNDGSKDITISGSVANSGIYGSASQFGFDVRDTSGNQGITALDNISVIPEPSTWALLAGGLTVLTIFRRRRTS